MIGEIIRWLTSGASWAGADGIGARLLEHIGYTLVVLVIAALVAVPVGLLIVAILVVNNLRDIDGDALVANWRMLGTRAGTEAAAVVKANAYGLGLEAVTGRLWAEGVRSFYVARVAEGERLRAADHDAEDRA